MMEAVSTSETPATFLRATRRNIPEDSYLHARRRENLKSYQVCGSQSVMWILLQTVLIAV
jgi:hypothetical protein